MRPPALAVRACQARPPLPQQQLPRERRSGQLEPTASASASLPAPPCCPAALGVAPTTESHSAAPRAATPPGWGWKPPAHPARPEPPPAVTGEERGRQVRPLAGRWYGLHG